MNYTNHQVMAIVWSIPSCLGLIVLEQRLKNNAYFQQ